MKKELSMTLKNIVLGIALLACTTAQSAERRRHPPNAVNLGTFYSMQRNMPPLPFNPFPDLPVATVSKGVFIYDDSAADYSARQAMIATVEEESLASFALMDFGANLHISSMTANGELMHVSIANAAVDTAYDVYYTPTLNPGFYWRLYLRGATNQTELDLAKPASPHGFFVAGSANDTDGDGLSDGFESLVTGTDPNLLDSDNDDVWDGPQDFDGDGAKNIDEFMLRTNPFMADSDGDGLSDGAKGGTTFATDGIDNDGDGLIDEAGESSVLPGPDLFPTDLRNMGKLRGDNQVGVLNQQLYLPFVVYLTNPNGTPVANGQTVTFSAKSPANVSIPQFLSNTSDSTGNNGFVGQAQTRLTLGAGSGTYTITAQWNGNTFVFTVETVTIDEVTATDNRYQTIDTDEVAGIVAHYRATVSGGNPAKSHVIGMFLSSEAQPSGMVCAAFETAPGSGIYVGSARTDALAPSESLLQAAATAEESEFYKFRFPDGVMEFCSADSGFDWSDSDLFDDEMVFYEAQERGIARHPNAPPPFFRLTDGFMRHAGRQTFHVVSYNKVNLIPSWMKNQCDIFYFSGHGTHIDGALLLSNGEQFTPQSLRGGDWKEDLNMAIFAGCSVLDVTGHKWTSDSNPAERVARPGKDWMKTGPKFLLGYEGSAPSDFGGVPQQVIVQFIEAWSIFFEGQGGDPAYIWTFVNLNNNANNACALDVQNNTVWHIVTRFGIIDVVESLPIP